MRFINPILLSILILLSFLTQGKSQTFSLDYPSGTPTFSLEEIAVQKTAGTALMTAIQAAAMDLNQKEFVIPAGNYGFEQGNSLNGTTNGFLLNGVIRPDNSPFTIKAQGVTFWFVNMINAAPQWGRAVYLNNCENVILEGLSIDTYTRNTIEGKLSKIDIPNNRIEITLLPGTFSDEAKILKYNSISGSTGYGSQCRIIPIKSNGNFISPLYNINNTWGPEYLWISNITKSSDGKFWLNFRNKTLLNTIFTTEWLNAYGQEGTLEIGDGISLLYKVMGGFVVDNSKQITIKDCTCYIGKANISEGGGYGNHKWINVKMISRPGTNQILGGDGNMSEGLRIGSTYDGCKFGLTSDDAINFHGFWGVAQSKNVNSLIMDRVPSGVVAGDTIQFYNINNGELQYSYIVSSITGPTATDINGNRRNVTVTFTTIPDNIVIISNSTIWARYTTAECANWVIKNTSFENNYQRILIQSGPGLFENNIVSFMGSGLTLVGNFASYEGGFIHDIAIKDNIFLGSSLYPNGNAIQILFTNKIYQNQWITDIKIRNNAFIGTGGEVIKIQNAKNITLDGNIIVNPLRYTALSTPTMSRAFTAFTGSNVSNVSILNNYLIQKDVYTNEGQFFNALANQTEKEQDA